MCAHGRWRRTFDDWSLICCHKPHLDLLTDPGQFLLTHRVARVGLVTLAEIVVDSDLSMGRAELCDAFRVVVPVSGHMECVHRGVSVIPGPGNAAVRAPGRSQWGAVGSGHQNALFAHGPLGRQ
jgi:hypothetical protein